MSLADTITTTRPDEELRLEIQRDPMVRSHWVDVGVSHGQITLKGRVRTGEEARLIEAVIERVPGVLAVVSRLDWEDER